MLLRRWLACAGVAACSDPAASTGDHQNLDRPNDIAFAQGYALILQSGPGTVALAQLEPLAVIDTDPLVPGANGISVGEDPIAIATDRAGCHALIANAGSRDLSDLDVTS